MRNKICGLRRSGLRRALLVLAVATVPAIAFAVAPAPAPAPAPAVDPAVASAADAPAFGVPADCAYGADCFIQNYVDAVPGAGHGDHRCGHLSYDGHKGTDVRVANLPAMRQGVPVVAAAAGRVRALRDGMPDVSITQQGRTAVEGREAGNGVLLDHGGGWVTQYSHLKQGSVRVRRGQQVAKGTVLGEIGLSGMTEFPHVEFQVRKDGQALDPFTGQAPEAGCEAEATPLWSADARERLDYVASAVLGAGFAGTRPSARSARAGRHDPPNLTGDSPVLVFWVDLMGPQRGDRQQIELRGPDGRRLVSHQDRLPKDQAQRFTYVGARRPDGGWPAGCYTAVYRLDRDGREIARLRRRVGVGAICR